MFKRFKTSLQNSGQALTLSLLPPEGEMLALENMDAVLNKIAAQKITRVLLNPPILHFIDTHAVHEDYFETPYCHTIVCLGEVDPALLARFQKRFKITVQVTLPNDTQYRSPLVIPESPPSLLPEQDIIAVAAEVFNVSTETLFIHAKPLHISAWDSLGHLRLIEATERHFGIRFEMSDIISIASLKELHERTERLLEHAKSFA